MVYNKQLMDYSTNNEVEMREIFRELSPQNQADLTIHARQFHTIQKKRKYEKTLVNDEDIGLYAGLRDKNDTRLNGES